MVTRPTCYTCWIRGRENNADCFIRFKDSMKLRPVCSDCLNDFLRRHLPTGIEKVSFDDGFEEWIIQEVQTT